MTYAIPSISLSSDADVPYSPGVMMTFARANSSVALQLAIGSLNISGEFGNAAWAYIFDLSLDQKTIFFSADEVVSTIMHKNGLTLTITLVGKRRGFLQRFKEYTQEQADANNSFWLSAIQPKK